MNNTRPIRVGEAVRVTPARAVIGGRNYTNMQGSVVRERFHVQGFTHLIEFSDTTLPAEWFHLDELEPVIQPQHRRKPEAVPLFRSGPSTAAGRN